MWAHRKKVGIYKVGRETLAEYRGTGTLASDIQALSLWKYISIIWAILTGVYILPYMSWEYKVTNISSDSRYYVSILV